MPESILISVEVYLLGFAIALLMAGVIKGMHAVIRRFSPEQEAKED